MKYIRGFFENISNDRLSDTYLANELIDEMNKQTLNLSIDEASYTICSFIKQGFVRNVIIKNHIVNISIVEEYSMGKMSRKSSVMVDNKPLNVSQDMLDTISKSWVRLSKIKHELLDFLSSAMGIDSKELIFRLEEFDVVIDIYNEQPFDMVRLNDLFDFLKIDYFTEIEDEVESKIKSIIKKRNTLDK